MAKQNEFQSTVPPKKFTDVVTQRKAARSHVYFKPLSELKKPMNAPLKKTLSDIIDTAGETTNQKLRAKIFLLDHTAEVLENFRRFQEYKIWKFELHSERERLVALKNQALDIENAIENYDTLYANRKYLADTQAQGEFGGNPEYRHQIGDFVENIRLRDQERRILEVTDPEYFENYNKSLIDGEKEQKEQRLFPKRVEEHENFEAYKKSLSSEPTQFNEYSGKVTELKNIRINTFFKDRTHNKELQKYLSSKNEEDEESQMLIEDHSQTDLIEHGKFISLI